MGCSNTKQHGVSRHAGSKRPMVKGHGEGRMYHDREWDSVTDSQVHTMSTYLPERGASSFCSLRREAGDGREESTSLPASDHDVTPPAQAPK